jgi:inorganic pyrophosphatase
MSYKNIPFGTSEAFNVLVEIPEGSYNKYEYDEELDQIKLDFVFHDKCVFPHNYGLIPGTRAEDGDNLDAIVLNPTPLAVGTIVPCRLIGMIELIDRGDTDNKIIAIPIACEEYKNIQSIEDLPEDFERKHREFYQLVGIQKNKEMKICGFRNKEKAMEELKKLTIAN